MAKKMGLTSSPSHIATGKNQRTESQYMESWLYLRSLLPREQWHKCKLTMAPPTMAHVALKPGTIYTGESGYTSDRCYFSDLCAVYHAEIKDLYDVGVRDV